MQYARKRTESESMMIETGQQQGTEDTRAIPKALWKVSSKLHGIADLFKHQEDDAAFTGTSTLGLGLLLEALASEISDLQEALETQMGAK